MSHMMVFVVTPSKPTHEELSAVLQPYHEFECTGTNDQYIREIDQTEEARAEYESDTEHMMVAEDGTMVSAWEKQFYREPTAEELEKHGPHGLPNASNRDWGDGKGYRAKVHFTPPGHTMQKVPVSQLRDFRRWLQDYYDRKELSLHDQPDFEGDHKFGYTRVGAAGEVLATYKRTNPDAEWDWWVMGGRYSQRLLMRPGTGPATLYEEPDYGFGGLFGLARNKPEKPPVNPLATDQVLLRDLDFEALRERGRSKGVELWDRAHAAVDGLAPVRSFKDILAELPNQHDVARKVYWAQPVVVALKAAFPDDWDLDTPLEALTMTRDEWGEYQADVELSSFALLHEGQWSQRGRMGWWGMVSDEKGRRGWSRHLAELLQGLPGEYCLTVVDCHI